VSSAYEELKDAIRWAAPARRDIRCKLSLDPAEAEPQLVMEFIEDSTGRQLFGPQAFTTADELGAAADKFYQDMAGL
jgi:hypothetical protein